MKSKEALEKIRAYHNQISLLCKGKLNNKIINAENQIEKDLNRIEKMEKAIKILKDKLEITINSHAEYFNQPMISGNEIYTNLTQEEYKLLKEVLEDES